MFNLKEQSKEEEEKNNKMSKISLHVATIDAINKPSYVLNDLEKIKKSLNFDTVHGNHPINHLQLRFSPLHNRLR